MKLYRETQLVTLNSLPICKSELQKYSDIGMLGQLKAIKSSFINENSYHITNELFNLSVKYLDIYPTVGELFDKFNFFLYIRALEFYFLDLLGKKETNR